MSCSILDSDITVKAGLDEVGYGCIFGPICAAAVSIFDREKLIENLPKHCVLRDSKKMTTRQLRLTYEYLTGRAVEQQWLQYGIGSKSHTYINEHGLSDARLHSFYDSLQELEDRLSTRTDSSMTKLQEILIDGNFFRPYKDIPYQTIVKGDASVLEIMCASIIAKHYRDSYIYSLVEKDESLQTKYKLSNNVGYATRDHLKGVEMYGPVEGHRTSYSLFKQVV